MSATKPMSESIRDERIDVLLNQYLPDDTNRHDFFSHTEREKIVYGLRGFHQAIQKSYGQISTELKDPDLPYLALFVNDGEKTATLSDTNISFLLDPAPKMVADTRPIKSPKAKTISLAQYLIHRSGGRFSIKEEQNQLTFWNNGQLMDTGSPDLQKRQGRGRKPKEATEPSEESEQEPMEWMPDPDNRYFLAFYWRPHRKKSKEKVGYAIVKAPLHNRSVEEAWKNTEITYWYSDGQHTTVATEVNMPDKRTLALRLIDAPDQDRRDVWTQITLDWPNHMAPVYTGAFASLSGKDRFRHPAAGLMVWWRQQSEAQCQAMISQYTSNSESIPVELFHFLLGRRVDVPVHDGVIESIESLPFAKNVRLLENIAQTYQGFFIHPSTGQVTLFSCKISAAGRVECRYPNNHKHPRMAGFAMPFAHGIEVDLDYNTDNGSYRLHYFLEGALTKDQYLLGVYAGFDHSLTYPTSGRVVLRVQPEPILLDLDMPQFRRDSQYAEVSGYLTGQKGLVMSTDSQVVDRLKGLEKTNQVVPLAGHYDLYMTERVNGDDPPEVFRHSLLLTETGMAFLSGNGREGEGLVLVSQDHLLSIQFGTPANQQVQGTLLVSLCDRKGYLSRYEQIQHLFGMATFVDQLRITSMVAVMKPSGKSDDTPIVPVDDLPIRFNRSMSVVQQNRTQADFDSYDSQLAGLLSALEGEAYRLIRLPKTPNHPFRPRRDRDRRTAFFAACYRAKQYVQDESDSLYNEIEAYLEEAYRHGFATGRFAGVSIKELSAPYSSPERLRQYMAQHNIEDTHFKKLKQDFKDLSQDYPLLIAAYDDPEVLGHEALKGIVERFWGDVNAYRPLVSVAH